MKSTKENSKPFGRQLGPLQKKWVEELRNNPDQQMSKALGIPAKKKFCCLGKALMIICEEYNLPIDVNEGGCLLSEGERGVLSTYDKIGLRNNVGAFSYEKTICITGRYFNSLADANDSGISWLDLADFIERNPEIVFTKSV